MKQHTRKDLSQDIGIIALSIIVAIVLVQTGIVIKMLSLSNQSEFLGSFFVGLFFTSIFTTAPAIVTLGEMAQVHSPYTVALWGAMGAVVGDLVIFRFIKDRFGAHLMELVTIRGTRKRLKTLLTRPVFRWVTFFIGGLILASPLPDELGIGLLGFSKMRLSGFLLVSFVFNFFGIVLIGFAARALL